ncbi:pentapeptide repeat-containing protein [Saccharothrix sp. Mg75]|uniref:pentapeptide repeat-containing protein n=1 Tax=Saccharothrix sp. Mg75 TaxID=3445357 RepID=UPI003EEB21E3
MSTSAGAVLGPAAGPRGGPQAATGRTSPDAGGAGMIVGMSSWLLPVAVALVVVWVGVRHARMARADALLAEHARRRVGPEAVPPSPVSVWREANRLFRAGDAEGLLLLAEIGRQVPRRRQDVVDAWVAALRGGVARGLDADWRRRVQGELVAHLRPGGDFWPGMQVVAPGAILVDLDLSGCRVGRVDLAGAVFVGDARFTAMTVTGDANFADARFLRHAVFTDALFARSVSFALAVFAGNVSLRSAQVVEGLVAARAKVSGRADFSGAEVNGPADFRHVLFGGRALFTDAVFQQDARFGHAWFRGRTDVGSALIGGEAEFEHARFGRRVLPT